MIAWIVTSSWLILVVVALRCLLREKISLRLQYALWGMVLVRLLMPIPLFSSAMSVLNLTDQIKVPFVPQGRGWRGLFHTSTQSLGNVPEQVGREGVVGGADLLAVDGSREEVLQQGLFSLPEGSSLGEVLSAAAYDLWVAGMVAVGSCLLLVNLRFAVRLKRSRCIVEEKDGLQSAYRLGKGGLPVYVSDMLETPCMFGLLHPVIYVTPELLKNKRALGHVLEHEMTHFRHGDHFWSLIRCICLALHWYNPLVWWAASLSKRDGELACDESVISRIGEAESAFYGRTLIGLTCPKHSGGGLCIAATTMIGSKNSIKERIMYLAKKPKMTIYTLVLVLFLSAVAVGCTFTGAIEDGTGQSIFSKDNKRITLQDEDVALAMKGLFDAGGGMQVTFHTADGKPHGTYTVTDGWMLARYGAIFRNFTWSVLEKADIPSGDFSITHTSLDGSKSITVWPVGDGILACRDGEKVSYWRAERREGYPSSLATDLRREYDEIEVNIDRMPSYAADNAEEAAAIFVHRAYGAHLLGLCPGGLYSIREYAVIDWGVDKISRDGRAMTGWMEYAVVPEDPYHYFGSASAQEGTGQYEGRTVIYQEFTLQKKANGDWHCVEIGTGGSDLPE